MTHPQLRIMGLSVSYGGVRAVQDVSIDVAAGQIVGLIGPNGAGKTSLVDAVTGFTRSAGTVLLAGVDISGLPPHLRARRGLARTWQSLELFDDLSVSENLEVGAEPAGALGLLRRVRADRPASKRALARVGLVNLEHRFPSDLSQGQRKVLGLARALVASPDVLLADEPAAGLDSRESRELGQRLRQIAEDGCGILLIDHDMSLILTVCDYVHVIDFGREIARGTPAEIRASELVRAAYLGDGGDPAAVESATELAVAPVREQEQSS